MCDPSYLFAAEVLSSQPQRVLSVTTGVIAYRAREWERVLYHHGIPSDEGVLPYSAELMNSRVGADRRVVFYEDVPGERRSISENNVVADAAVVRNVGLRHDEVVRAELGYITAAFGAALQRREFSKRVSLASAQPASLALVFQVLRRLARGNKREKNCSATELRWSFDDAMTSDANIVSQNYVIADN